MKTGRNSVALLFAAALLSGCAARTSETPAAGEPQPCRFVEITDAAGVRHEHAKPRLDPKVDNIREWVSSVGAGVSAADFDRDGWIDLYVTTSDKGQPNVLYRNSGDGTFTDAAEKAGLARVNDEGGTSMHAVWGDYDNDGWADLYLVRWGRDRLFHNAGDGTFVEVTEQCFRRRDGTPGTDWANGNAAVFFDYDLDGRLDIYVGNYFQPVDLWHLESTRIMHDDFEKSRNGGENFLFHQEPDGTFTEVAALYGVNDPGWTLAVGSADVNNDGRPDLYCANDFGPDQLFLNDPAVGFDNVSEVALGFDSKKGMNVDFGDVDNDGWLDIFITNITTAEYLQEGNMLWLNQGPGDFGVVHFTDIASQAGVWDGGWGWGAKFFDAECDGDLDIVQLNGFITGGAGDYWYDLASWTVLGKDPAEALNWPEIAGRSFSGREPKRFWCAVEPGVFQDLAAEVGLENRFDGRAVACLDYDNDGDLDLYFANQGQPSNFYRNDSSRGHWLELALVTDPATATNRDGIGTRVTIETSRGIQIRERDGGNGYAGQSEPRIHFGLGPDTQILRCEVKWVGGGIQPVELSGVDRLVEVRQDPSKYVSQPVIAIAPPTRREKSSTPAKPSQINDEELLAALTAMENELRASLERRTPASAYRSLCAENSRHDRSIEFFSGLVQKSNDSRARLELSLAYVDKIPTCGGLAAIVSKGTLARKSLDQLDHLIQDDEGSWVAHYARGMNHLYWPRSLRHSDDAVADLARCVELQGASGDPAGRAHFLRAHVALGDAYAKAKKFDQAREAWQNAQRFFPQAEELQARLAITKDEELLAFVEARRSLQEPIDTNLSFLDVES